MVAACSTGLVSLLRAADHVHAGRCEVALAGSVDTPLHPLLLGCYRRMGVACRGRMPSAFTGAGSGFAPAEGAAVVRLGTAPGPWRLLGGLRLADASHETRCGDAAVLRRCLDQLWMLLPEPDLIIAHATGTRAGDAFEQTGLDTGPWRDCPRLVCKPSIGHCLGASGLVELCAGLHAPADRLWKISLGFGGHIAAVAVMRNG
ncbi:MAG: beta-ketoacyl synthase N-terminal-like domain-containing protein [Planctomycetota bacterium]